jgi:glycosyltransferase involved in cell wall biosynthesis
MRIAQIAPLQERVPPHAYGGIELVVSLLTEELVRRGHEVTLFASGDSQTHAHLASVYPRSLRMDPEVQEYEAYELLQLSQVYEQANQFDIIHSHVGYTALPFTNLVKTPTVHTLHSLNPDSYHLFSHYRHQPYISISNAQRQPVPELNFVGTVYNGIDTDTYPFHPHPQDPPYLAFLGRFSPEKGPHHAIAVAQQTGWPLKMAGKVDRVDQAFFDQEIAPHIDGKQIEFWGEADHQMKVNLLGNAALTLFPITWQEPFGLVMVESMCTGTPVIGIGLGSVPEVIAHGQSGWVCQRVEEIVAAIPAALALDRQACRDHVLNHFSVASMVNSYLAAYRQVLGQSSADREPQALRLAARAF